MRTDGKIVKYLCIFASFYYLLRFALSLLKFRFSVVWSPQLYTCTFPGANMVQGKHTLGYLRTRTFYKPERKYAYKYASITKCLTYSPPEM